MLNADGEGDAPEGRQDAEYQVGDKKLPLHTRSKPGVSGNQKGRGKGSVNLRTRVQQGLRKTIVVNENGRPTRMAVLDVITNRLLESSMKGDLKAIQFVLRSDQEATAVEAANQGDAEEVNLPDKESLRLIAERLRYLTEEGE